MAKRRKFTDLFMAKVALEALRGDGTIQAIAAKHQVHPNQVRTWKRQAVEHDARRLLPRCSERSHRQTRPARGHEHASGQQVTGAAWITNMTEPGARISMDGQTPDQAYLNPSAPIPVAA